MSYFDELDKFYGALNSIYEEYKPTKTKAVPTAIAPDFEELSKLVKEYRALKQQIEQQDQEEKAIEFVTENSKKLIAAGNNLIYFSQKKKNLLSGLSNKSVKRDLCQKLGDALDSHILNLQMESSKDLGRKISEYHTLAIRYHQLDEQLEHKDASIKQLTASRSTLAEQLTRIEGANKSLTIELDLTKKQRQTLEEKTSSQHQELAAQLKALEKQLHDEKLKSAQMEGELRVLRSLTTNNSSSSSSDEKMHVSEVEGSPTKRPKLSHRVSTLAQTSSSLASMAFATNSRTSVAVGGVTRPVVMPHGNSSALFGNARASTMGGKVLTGPSNLQENLRRVYGENANTHFRSHAVLELYNFIDEFTKKAKVDSSGAIAKKHDEDQKVAATLINLLLIKKGKGANANLAAMVNDEIVNNDKISDEFRKVIADLVKIGRDATFTSSSEDAYQTLLPEELNGGDSATISKENKLASTALQDIFLSFYSSTAHGKNHFYNTFIDSFLLYQGSGRKSLFTELKQSFTDFYTPYLSMCADKNPRLSTQSTMSMVRRA